MTTYRHKVEEEEEVEFLPSPPPSPTRQVEEDTPREDPPPPNPAPAPRRVLLGPLPVSSFLLSLRAIPKSIAEQTERYF